jgi:ABC-type branched-subunit amino acid transport system ATPase component
MLRIEHLKKYFGGVHAVDGVSLEILPGRITGIVGPNGSGKSTLTHLLTGMVAFDSGVLIADGERVASLRAFEAAEYGITRTFQEVRLFEQITVLDNFLVVLTERGVFAALWSKHTAAHEKRAEEILRRVGLWEKRHQMAKQLSYGQRKLLEVGRAMAMSASVYLFDEPFAGLFPEMTRTLVEVLQELRTQGKAVVLIEHNMRLIRELADQVVVMDSGKVLAEGTPASVLTRKDVIEAYLGE